MAVLTATPSLWAETAKLPQYSSLKKDLTVDVCVVGGGIAGMSVAYLLSQAGKRVALIDDGAIASGQTQMTTAHLSNAIDDCYQEIERLHGEEGARLAAESHTAAIDLIETVSRQQRINCDFHRVDGYLFNAPGEPADLLDRELEAARRTGAVQVDRVSRAPLAGFDTGPCLRFRRQGQFHPLKYLAGLAGAIGLSGGQIFSQTHAQRIEGGQPARVSTARGPVITAQAVVVATNTPVNDLVAIHTKQAPYMTYVVGLRVPAGSVERALYWDTVDPYHYVRLQPEEYDDSNEILIVGGEDHKTGQADDGPERFERLERWARERFGDVGEAVYRWSGQVMETIDGVAFIGRNPLDKDNVYIATGDSGMGMTHGTIAGMLLSDLILGKDNPWAKLYDPSRKTLRAASEFAKENANVMAQYTSWATPGEVASVDEIPLGEGAIVRRGLKKLAVYRDPGGRLVELSAACTHLKCIVAWNATEKTWDCPCHGSRFAADGRVINGPANRGLERAGEGSA